MNSGELDREDFGFSVAEGSLARPGRGDGKEGKTVNGKIFMEDL